MTEEEKDKLIALSDLNREDNIKYISSEAQGIAIALDSDRYAPTLCKLERAYICGRRKSEEQIADLEKAKELLKRYVKIYVNPYPEEEIELRNEAEQFLNSDVENEEEQREDKRISKYDKDND